MRVRFRSLILIYLLTLILPFSPQAISLSRPIAPEAMPPHPALLQRLERGEVNLPPHLANPALARSRAKDQAGNWESYPVNPDYDTFITVATGQGKNVYLPMVIK